MRLGFLEFPAGPLGAIFNADAGRGQGIADGVGPGEVFRLAGGLPLIQLGADEAVQNLAGLGAGSAGGLICLGGVLSLNGEAVPSWQPLGVQGVKAEDVQHGPHQEQAFFQQGDRLILLGAFRQGVQVVHGCVPVADGAEDGSQGGGDVEVIVHGRDEILGKLVCRVRCHFLATGLADRRSGVIQEVADAGVSALGFRYGLLAPFQHGPVLDGCQGVTDHPGGALAEHDRDGEAIAQGFAHLFTLLGDPGRVHPVMGETPARRAGLGHLVFVVGETQIQAASVNVELIAQVAVAHGRALQVPARPAGPEGGPPTGGQGVGILGGLPEGEIAGVMLFFRQVGLIGRVVLVFSGRVHGGAHGVGDAGGFVASRLSAGLLMGQFAVMGPGGDVKVDIAGGGAVRVGNEVGVAAVYQPLDQVHHVGDVPGRSRLVSRGEDAQNAVGLGKFLLVVVGPGPPVLSVGGGLVQDLVIDVGHVAHESDLVAQLHEPAADHVKGNPGPHMPHMRGSLDSGPAHVHGHLARRDRPKIHDLMMRGVVYAHPARRLSQLTLRLDMHSVFRGCHSSCSHDSKRFCLGQILAHDCYWEVELAL